MAVIPIDNPKEAAENRKRVEALRSHQPYYWWEYPDIKQVTKSNPGGLARSREELMKRMGVNNG
jgi:hypothetical protein